MEKVDSQYPENIVKLFALTKPTELFINTKPAQFKDAPFSLQLDGISQLLPAVKDYDTEFQNANNKDRGNVNDANGYKSKKALNFERNQLKLKESLLAYDPDTDPHITGDPLCTIFVGRLSFNTNEIELNEKFNEFGEIEKVRVVRDLDKKSKGYGFVVYKNKNDAKSAIIKGNGNMLGDRKIIVDVERARIVKNWKPRRLGGGLGGRRNIDREKRDRDNMFGSRDADRDRNRDRDRDRDRDRRFERHNTMTNRFRGRDRGRDRDRDRNDRYSSNNYRQDRYESMRGDRGGNRGHSGTDRDRNRPRGGYSYRYGNGNLNGNGQNSMY